MSQQRRQQQQQRSQHHEHQQQQEQAQQVPVAQADRRGGGESSEFLSPAAYAGRLEQLKAVMLECLTDDAMREITKALIEQAKEGNVSAAKLLFQYVFGKPAEGGGGTGDARARMGSGRSRGAGLAGMPFDMDEVIAVLGTREARRTQGQPGGNGPPRR